MCTQITGETIKYNDLLSLKFNFEFTFAGDNVMIGTGERPVLASCFIYTSYPARPQPHLSIPVVWDLKSKKKKKINTHTHMRASHAHTGRRVLLYVIFF